MVQCTLKGKTYLCINAGIYLLTHSLSLCREQNPSWETTGSQLVKIFPAFEGTSKLTTAFTKARELSLFWATAIQSMPSIPPTEDPF
jgi:hypothetical protein